MSTTLTSLTVGADLLVTGVSYEELALNVADYHKVPLATLLWFPIRVNGRLFPEATGAVDSLGDEGGRESLVWQGLKKLDGEQRRELGLPKATGTAPQRIAERRWLEIQGYDEVCFPDWPSNGRNGTASDHLSAHSRWSHRRMPMTKSRPGLPRGHRRSSSDSAASRSIFQLTQSR